MNIKTSNMTTGVRGTSGNVTIVPTKTKDGVKTTRTELTLLKGKLAVVTREKTELLQAGFMLTVTNPLEGKNEEIVPDVQEPLTAEMLGAFELRAVIELGVLDIQLTIEIGKIMDTPATELVALPGVREKVDDRLPANLSVEKDEIDQRISKVDEEIAAAEKAAAENEAAIEKQIQEEKAQNLKDMERAENAITEGALETVDQVFEPKTIGNSKGANAEDAPFKEEEKTPASSGGGGGGGSSNTFSISYYSGTYDGSTHAAMTLINDSNYIMYYFNSADDNSHFQTDLETAKNLVSTGAISYSAIESELSSWSSHKVGYTVSDVADSLNLLYYYGVAREEGAADVSGSGRVSISPMTVGAYWTYTSDAAVAVPNVSIYEGDLTAGFWPVRVTATPGGAAMITTPAPVTYEANRSYTISVLGLDDGNGTPVQTMGNYCMPSSALSYTFNVLATPCTSAAVLFNYNAADSTFTKVKYGDDTNFEIPYDNVTGMTIDAVIEEINSNPNHTHIGIVGVDSGTAVPQLGSINLPDNVEYLKLNKNLGIASVNVPSTCAIDINIATPADHTEISVGGNFNLTSGSSIVDATLNVAGNLNISNIAATRALVTVGGNLNAQDVSFMELTDITASAVNIASGAGFYITGEYGGDPYTAHLYCGAFNSEGYAHVLMGTINCESFNMTGNASFGSNEGGQLIVRNGSMTISGDANYRTPEPFVVNVNTTGTNPGVIISDNGVLDITVEPIYINAPNAAAGIRILDHGQFRAKEGSAEGGVNVTAASVAIDVASDDASLYLEGAASPSKTLVSLNQSSMKAFSYTTVASIYLPDPLIVVKTGRVDTTGMSADQIEWADIAYVFNGTLSDETGMLLIDGAIDPNDESDTDTETKIVVTTSI